MSTRKWILPAALTALGTLAPGAASAHVDTAVIWHARFSSFKGNLGCGYGDADCNRCVYKVESQFRALTQTSNHTRRVKEWEFQRTEGYAPSGLHVREVTAVTPAGNSHFQGFARGAGPGLDLFATYADVDDGLFEAPAIMAIQAGPDSLSRITDGELKYVYDDVREHPGGLQVIGSKVVVAHYDSNAEVRITDTSEMPSGSGTDTPLLGLVEMASLGGLQLAGGGYLMIVNEDSKTNGYRVAYTSSLDKPHFEPVWKPSVNATFPSATGNWQGGFENLTAVTECGTGKTFVIGATAEGIYATHKGIWSLFELKQSSAGVVLQHLTKNTRQMYAPECDPRAAGTGFAGEHGELGLYCHQKLQDVNARRDAAKCGLSAGISVLFGIPTGWEYFCGEAVVGDKRLRFTEYWPTGGTPETVAVAERTLTVRINTMPPYSDGLMAGVLDATRKATCISDDGKSMTCSWKVPSGTTLKLVPMADPGYTTITWGGGTCANRNYLSQENPNWAAECSVNVTQDMTLDLNAAILI